MKQNWAVRWLVALVVVGALVFGMVGTAQAVTIKNNGSIAAGETINDDVVLSGNIVSMDGTINGTLIAAGSTITINGTINGDAIVMGQSIIVAEKAVITGNLFVAGANIEVKGKVSGSIFGGSAALQLAPSASISRNLYHGGFSLETQAGSKVGYDILAGGYQAIIAGESRNLKLADAAIDLSGTVNGDADLTVSEPGNSFNFNSYRFGNTWVQMPPQRESGLRITSSAKISGKLTYTSPAQQQSAIQSSPEGGVVYQTPQPDQRADQPRTQIRPFNFDNLSGGLWVWSLLQTLLTLIVLGLLAAWRMPNFLRRTVIAMQQKPLQSAGIGVLSLAIALVGVPVLILVLGLLGLVFGLLTLGELAFAIFSLGFAALGLACVLFALALIWIGRLALSYIIGEWIFRKSNSPAAANRYWPGMLGAVIVAVLGAIPFIGWLFTFVVMLVGLGAIWYAWRTPKTIEPK